MALQKHKISLSAEQWDLLKLNSKSNHISVSALVRQLVDKWSKDLRKEIKQND